MFEFLRICISWRSDLDFIALNPWVCEIIYIHAYESNVWLGMPCDMWGIQDISAFLGSTDWTL